MRLLERLDGEVLVSADPGHVRMLTGHTQEIEVGPSPFALSALVVGPGDGAAILVCSEDEAPAGVDAVTFAGFTAGPIDRVGAARAALVEALGRVGRRSRVLLDGASVPAALAAAVPGVREPAPDLASLTAVKTDAEVAGIEAALRLCEVGQAAARATSRAGVSELELWAAVRSAVEGAAGARTPLVADVVSGPRTADVGGPPGPRRLAARDLVLCDLVPRLDGLWGDSCATWAVDAPPDDARALHEAARTALEVGLAGIRPGVSAGAVDAAVRGVLAEAGFSYPHHTGHGLGFAFHEEPRIVAGSTTVLEAGMVLALEPGGYPGPHGIRVEQVAVVTADGCRVLSRHSLDLEA